MNETDYPVASTSAAAAKALEKSQSNVSQKHSTPFFISPTLFQNKCLKRKRMKWAKELNIYDNTKTSKTERRKRHPKKKQPQLHINVTIDLLSDDDDNIPNTTTTTTTTTTNGQKSSTPIKNYEEKIEICKVPNITLTPVDQFALHSFYTQRLGQQSQQINNINNQRKRKSRKPKRLPQPTIVNNESIVLSDDSDEVIKNELNTLTTVSPVANSEPPHFEKECNNVQKNYRSPQSIIIPRIEQVDDEVTVSLVPRSSTAGTCPKPASEEVFPMLPDETTVHTVIANRIYELSLTKLREGLATSGVTEYSSEPQKILTQKRKNNGIMPQVSPQPTPVSLKLSSDLSISLISDEEEEEERNQQQERSEKLLQQQQHLSVQEIQVPITTATENHQTPRRRKLG